MPTATAQTGPHLPFSLQHVVTPTASGAYRTHSEQREGSVPRSERPERTSIPADEGWPLGYIVASAFFLAIAVVGFGLWLAFEVISL